MVWRLPDEISVVPQRNEMRLPGRQNIITFANHKQAEYLQKIKSLGKGGKKSVFVTLHFSKTCLKCVSSHSESHLLLG